jgi:hypothetical protein
LLASHRAFSSSDGGPALSMVCVELTRSIQSGPCLDEGTWTRILHRSVLAADRTDPQVMLEAFRIGIKEISAD